MSFTGKTALLVEDDETIRVFLRNYLRRMGFDVVEASDGIDGLRLLGTANPSLIVTDLAMPRMDGIGFIEEVRRIGSKLPILAITGAIEEKGAKALAAGATMVIYKPIFRMKLMDAVEKVMRM